MKLQIERRRQKEILKKKLEDDNKKVVANSANDFSQQNQLSMINTHVNSEVAALKDRLVKEKDRQRDKLRRRLAERKRRSSGHKDKVDKAAEAAYTFYTDKVDPAPGEIIKQLDATSTGSSELRPNNAEGNAAINYTLSSHTDKTTKALLSARLGNMSNILFKMVRTKKSGALKAMLDAGSDVFVKNEAGDTLLIEAAKVDDIDLLHLLIARGGKQLLNAQNYEGNTALHYIFARGDPVSASFLIANGADESLKNMYGLSTREGVKMSDYDNLQF